MIEYNDITTATTTTTTTTTTYNMSIYIIHRWDSNMKIELLIILLYNINTVLSLLLL